MWRPFITALLGVATFTAVESATFQKKNQLGIINGVEVEPHSAPYMAYVLTELKNGGGERCAGTLIADKYVLTSASCLKDAKRVGVDLGVHVREDYEHENIKRMSAKNWTEFDKKDDTYKHDIAIIELDRSATDPEDPHIQIVKLPTSKDDEGEYLNHGVAVFGWGQLENDPWADSSVLRYGRQTAVKIQICKDRGFPNVTDENICTIPQPVTSYCRADTGGPLMFEGIQIGIASVLPNYDCEPGKFNIYTNVYSYIDWIINNTKISIE